MAELDVQQKKKSPWWLWLLIALIVLAIIFFFLNRNDNDAEENDDYEPETGAVDAPSTTFYASCLNTVDMYSDRTA